MGVRRGVDEASGELLIGEELAKRAERVLAHVDAVSPVYPELLSDAREQLSRLRDRGRLWYEVAWSEPAIDTERLDALWELVEFGASRVRITMASDGTVSYGHQPHADLATNDHL